MNNRVRIVIVGDSGVGKTCLTHLIAHNESLTRPGWTVGCNIQVKIHEFKEGTARQSPYFVELFDIGGSLSHKNTRSIFYTGVHGIILVHDLTNVKSQEQLLEWLFEIVNKEGKDTYKCRATSRPTTPLPNYGQADAHLRFDLEEFLGATQTPILVIGTKLDLVDERRQPKTAVKKAGGIADKCGAEEIWLNCRDTRSLAAGTTDAVKLSRFFDCVIEKRESIGSTASHVYGGMTQQADRRRGPSTSASLPNSPEFSLYAPTSKIGLESNGPLLETGDLK
ncbi:rab-like protein 3 [Scaptodrosophila lebanonensis]|uniref:Rab-like protein 3 n=1 Tax=Drosophila lebanonensis TaxID=7225 RepID=A0A6J2UHH6_DROLE|nr:rab-like protein 3 [Scaptodrosophila lebanonensis]